MAQTVHLYLEINGRQVEGESTVSSLERDRTIECSSFQYGLKTPYDAATGAVSAKRQHGPVVIRKRIDKSTPLLLKALCRNESVDVAWFRFYRPHKGDTGAEEHFYSVRLRDGRIASMSQLSEDAIVAGVEAPPMLEEVEFVFREIEWEYEIGGAEHQDSWQGDR